MRFETFALIWARRTSWAIDNGRASLGSDATACTLPMPAEVAAELSASIRAADWLASSPHPTVR
jgi:hypothetical protein